MRAWIYCSSVLLLPACGGNVVASAASGTGGASTSINASSSSASSSSTGGSVTTSSASSGAGGSVTTTSSSTGAGGGIPNCDTFGAVGAGLECDPEGLSCLMPYSCCSAGLTCKAGVWTANTPTCNSACLPCGDGLACSLGAICVHDTAVYDFYQCVKNPCPGAPTCTCAAEACGMNFQQCKSTQMFTVTCGN